MSKKFFLTPVLALPLFVAALAGITGCSQEPAEAVQPAEVVVAAEQPAPIAAQPAANNKTALPSKAKNFGLLDQNGKFHELRRYGRDSKAIVLYSTGNGCPIARHTSHALHALRDKFGPQGVIFLMLNGNLQDDRKSIVAEATEFKMDIPILIDHTQLVTSQLGIARTCEALLIDPKSLDIVYRGAIDDRVDYETQKSEPSKKYLEDALTAHLAGQPIQLASSETRGCLIDVEPLPKNISYTKDIVPILQARCVRCHSEGNIGPFAFDAHDEVAGRGGMIREVTMTNRMPPWHADAPQGVFANDSSLSRDDMRKLFAWFDNGAQKDGDVDPLIEIAAAAETDWPLGKPDLIVDVPEQTIQATGTIPYIKVVVPSGLTEDKWVRAVDLRPSNRAVSHHILAFPKYPDAIKDQEPDFDGGIGGYFAGYLPGQEVMPFPEGSAKWLPAGVSFHFQFHYTTTGKEEKDHTQLGLYFQDEKPERMIQTDAGSTPAFEIPPNTYDHPVEAEFGFYRDSLLYSMSPHMHFRGSHMQYTAYYPDGSSELLLSVPNYQFNWQTLYTFAEPKAIPAGTLLKVTGGFDNSVRNAFNPDPTATVRFGEQTWEEMFVAYLNYSSDPNSEVVRPKRNRGNDDDDDDEGIRTGIPLNAENIIGSEWTGDKYTFLFGANGEMTINKVIKGKYEIVGDELRFTAAGNDFTFYIRGDVLCPEKDRDWHFRRLK
ncbi:MAG TPA: redoxin domain-containing protein [Candidatus Hydrogenedentes bacterium]|nr:redoxin domain-containing protein [Candidatus Hydrogenedentota bacterium]